MCSMSAAAFAVNAFNSASAFAEPSYLTTASKLISLHWMKRSVRSVTKYRLHVTLADSTHVTRFIAYAPYSSFPFYG